MRYLLLGLGGTNAPRMYEFSSSNSPVLATLPLGNFRGRKRGCFPGLPAARHQRRLTYRGGILPRRGIFAYVLYPGLHTFGKTDLASFALPQLLMAESEKSVPLPTPQPDGSHGGYFNFSLGEQDGGEGWHGGDLKS